MNGKKSFTVFQKLVTVFLSVITGLIICEIALNVWLYSFADRDDFTEYARLDEIPAEHWWYIDSDPYLPYRPNPDYSNGLLSHNSRGFRSKELTIPKPEDTFRVAILGGSTVYTIKVNDNTKTFPHQLETLLREKHESRNIEVLNAGVGGYTSWECLINFAFFVLDYEPDLLIMYLGVNDVHARFVETDSFEGNNQGYRTRWKLPGESVWDMSNLMRIIRRKWGLSPRIGIMQVATARTYDRMSHMGSSMNPHERNTMYVDILKNNSPGYFERNVRNIIAMAKAHDVSVMLSTWAHSPNMQCYAALPYYRLGFQQHNQILRNTADDLSLPIFDFASVMPEDRKYWADGRHVNEEGAYLKASLFADFIRENDLIRFPQ